MALEVLSSATVSQSVYESVSLGASYELCKASRFHRTSCTVLSTRLRREKRYPSTPRPDGERSIRACIRSIISTRGSTPTTVSHTTLLLIRSGVPQPLGVAAVYTRPSGHLSTTWGSSTARQPACRRLAFGRRERGVAKFTVSAHKTRDASCTYRHSHNSPSRRLRYRRSQSLELGWEMSRLRVP